MTHSPIPADAQAISGSAACKQGFHFSPRNSATFAKERYEQTWLVQDVLAACQPAVIGGPKKTLKTSIGLDMAISLGSGKPFLGQFAVPKKVCVAVLSGENGNASLQETALRICKAKGISLESCNVLWQTDLPQLNSSSDRQRLSEGLAKAAVKVAIIDPLYLCLLSGGDRVAASNLYEVGPLLLGAAKACLDAGATPVFVHHATKTAGKRTASKKAESLDLEDLAFAGIGEFARQWLLLDAGLPTSWERGSTPWSWPLVAVPAIPISGGSISMKASLLIEGGKQK